MTKLGSRGGGKAAKRSSSWFTSSSLVSSSLTSSISVSEISSSVKTGGFDIAKVLTDFKPDEVVTLFQIEHFREPINKNSSFCHHFGVLEVRLPPPEHRTTALISFEKGKDTEKPSTQGTVKLKPSGKVNVYIMNADRVKSKKPLLTVNLEGCPKIQMQDLLKLLTTEHTPSYTLWTNNCWKYVYDCLKKMLCTFAEHAGTSPACKELLVKHLQNLRPPALLSDVFKWKMLARALRLSGTLGSFFGDVVISIFTFFKTALIAMRGMVMAVKGLGTCLPLLTPHTFRLATQAMFATARAEFLATILDFVLGHLKVKAIATAVILVVIFGWWLADVINNNRMRRTSNTSSQS